MGFLAVCYFPAAAVDGDPAEFGAAVLRLAVRNSHLDGPAGHAVDTAAGFPVGRAGTFHSTQAALLRATGEDVTCLVRGQTARVRGPWMTDDGAPVPPGDIDEILRSGTDDGWVRPVDGTDHDILRTALNPERASRVGGGDAGELLAQLGLPGVEFPSPAAGGIHVVALHEDGLRALDVADDARAATIGAALLKLASLRWESGIHEAGVNMRNVGRALPGCDTVLAAHHNGVASFERIAAVYPDWAHDIRAAFLPEELRPSRN